MKKIAVSLVCILLVALLTLPGMAAAPDRADGVEAAFCHTDGVILATVGAAAGEAEDAPSSSLEDVDTGTVVLVMVIIGVVVVGFGLGAVLWLGRKKPMPPTHGFETKYFLDDQKKEETEE